MGQCMVKEPYILQRALSSMMGTLDLGKSLGMAL